MTGYQSDQFFNIGRTRPDRWRGGSPSSFVDNNALNQSFRYPDNTIRTTLSDGTYSTRVLQKGYIRRINEFDDSATGPVICRFQFNPQFINQQASFNSSITNPIYQPVEQLQQPIASMTNFGFRLYFDRSMELNEPSTLRTSATDNPWEAGGPNQVGVLHDINALYRVIGQGISSSDVAAALERAAQSLAAEDARVGKRELTPEEQQNYNEAVGNASSFFDNNVNIGNTAFILPYPVRIVFSSLYIVEGFVTSTALEILKFNSAYVPMIAQVTLGVSAIYLGFAKQNTYFTHVLEKSAIDRRNELAAAQDAENSALRSIRANLNVINFRTLPSASTNIRSRSILPTPTSIPTSFGELFFNQSNITVRPSNVFASLNNFTNRPEEQDNISKLFKDGVIQSIDYKWKATLIGPYNGSAIGNAREANVDLDSFLNISKIRTAKNKTTMQKVGIKVNTSDEWRSQSTSTRWDATRRSNVARMSFPAGWNIFNDRPLTNQYYAFLLEAEVEVKLTSGPSVSNSFTVRGAKVIEFSETDVVSGTDKNNKLSGAIFLDWNAVLPEVAPRSSTATQTSTRSGAPPPGTVAPPRTIDPREIQIPL